MGENKVLPFDTELGFTALPKAVCQFYVRHPKFNPSAERLYRYLLSRFNANYGYAFPSWNSIVRETALSKGTVSAGLVALEELGLINRFNHNNGGDFSNKIYTFNKPIENEAEFMMRFEKEIAELSGKKRPKGGKKKEGSSIIEIV
ncbi:helix-turn-helix domain-containing protein [Gottfriedia luciferensis]|uniref:helix-turn-helix domain-containing protein n=1 Tax=Gottfriedia luciferensis TaxID=178774 RepID=UPI000B43D89D|nr:helix-turn-helix domain-containing protein [Gottfriedia luciferensis]